jgi:predicted ribosome quality control (RQC) complex YloA/Tae2 family protein
MIYVEKAGDNTIKIGRNCEDNDILLKTCSLDSLWFHLKGMASPHGFLMGPSISDEHIYKTASLVKQFSKAKNIENVSVEYLPLKYVKLTGEKKGEVYLTKKPNKIFV